MTTNYDDNPTRLPGESPADAYRNTGRPEIAAEIERADLPIICIEMHRYTQPSDGWVFYWLAPHEEGDQFPFDNVDGDFDFERARYYKARIEGWGSTEWAQREWAKLEGFSQIAWEDLPTNLRSYANFYVAPLEWQRGLATGDPEVISMIKVWIKGELPS